MTPYTDQQLLEIDARIKEEEQIEKENKNSYGIGEDDHAKEIAESLAKEYNDDH